MASVYLDYNATAPPSKGVVDAVSDTMTQFFGNASAMHGEGRKSRAKLAQLTASVAGHLDVPEASLIWTSGSTESINTYVASVLGAAPAGSNVIVSPTEHKAVLESISHHAERGRLQVRQPKVDADGRVSVASIEELLDRDTALVAVMGANNETGVLNPVVEIGELLRDRTAAFLCDATQMLGRVPVASLFNVADCATFSAHKVHGPIGVGCAVVPSRSQRRALRPLILGGGQQNGVRAGTLNIPGIAGFATALDEAFVTDCDFATTVGPLRDRLEALLCDSLGDVHINGAGAPRLANTANLRIVGVDGEALVATTHGVAFSTGSACSASVPAPSHVLRAMGLSDEAAGESVRLSLGRSTTDADVEMAAELVSAAAIRIREVNG